MYKVKIVDPFYDLILETELPTIPTINECISFWFNGELTEFDIRAVTHYIDQNNKFEFVEICVELGVV